MVLMKQYVDTHELHPEKIVGVEDRIVIMRDLTAKIAYTKDEWMDKDILFRAREALAQGDVSQIGSLMIEAQRFFDLFMAPACPEELLSPKLHFVLSNPKFVDLTVGGKGVGSQGDGSVQFVVRGEKEQKKLYH